MPAKLCLVLSAPQIKELEQARDHHPLPYVRERAAALLQIAAGQAGRQVAQHGLLKPRWPDRGSPGLAGEAGARAQARFFPLRTPPLTRRATRSCLSCAVTPLSTGKRMPAGPSRRCRGSVTGSSCARSPGGHACSSVWASTTNGRASTFTVPILMTSPGSAISTSVYSARRWRPRGWSSCFRTSSPTTANPPWPSGATKATAAGAWRPP